jgi:hypothetical protein
MPFKDFTFIAAGRLMLARLQARRASPVCLRRSRLIVGGFGCRRTFTRPTTPYTTSPLETAMTQIAARVTTFSQAQPDCSKLAVARNPQYENCQSYLMSRSLGSDGIRRYCDAAVALTFVFATVIAMVAAVIVGSNATNFQSR